MANILIVDDQPYFRELLSEELIHEGYRVSSIGDAESIHGHFTDSRPDRAGRSSVLSRKKIRIFRSLS